MAESGFEKTEAPTPRKRSEAREQGNVARSTDLNAACILLGAILLLYFFGRKMLFGMKVLVESMLSDSLSINPTQADDVDRMLQFAGRVVLEMMAPMGLGIFLIALLVSVSQTGLLFTLKPLEFNLTKLSPLKGAARLFDARAGMRLVMSLGKVALIAGLAVWLIHLDLPRIVGLAELEVLPMFSAACELVFFLALKLAVLLLILALLDYAFQRWQHEKDLRMSKQEVKEDMKRMEGDPLVKQRRMRVARQLALQRIGQAVPQADVVVTNPTHFSVALKYDPKTMTAPKVVAKGADFLAMRIRQIAIANDVPLVERKEIAQALYKTVEVGQEVPPGLYNAVAEVLAYVYRISGRKTA